MLGSLLPGMVDHIMYPLVLPRAVMLIEQRQAVHYMVLQLAVVRHRSRQQLLQIGGELAAGRHQRLQRIARRDEANRPILIYHSKSHYEHRCKLQLLSRKNRPSSQDRPACKPNICPYLLLIFYHIAIPCRHIKAFPHTCGRINLGHFVRADRRYFDE